MSGKRHVECLFPGRKQRHSLQASSKIIRRTVTIGPEKKGNVYLFLYSKSNMETEGCQGGGDYYGKYVSPNVFFVPSLPYGERIAGFLRGEGQSTRKEK